MRHNKNKNFITLLNVSLLLLLAFIGYQTAKKILGARTEPVSVELVAAKGKTTTKNRSISSNPSLSDYKTVWERNLFNTSDEMHSQPQQQVNVATVAEADNSIGLKLLGTVAADASANRFTVIEYDMGQNIYHEGDVAGSYVIKKISRDNVIIVSENGDLLALKLDHAGPGDMVLAALSQTPSGTSRPNSSGGRFKAVALPREKIMAAFDDIDRLIRDVKTSSYKFGKLSGFRIGSVSDNSILNKIGLRSHDKILAINDKSIGDANGALTFFEQISEGKKVTIKYRRRNRTRRIELNPI